jgi:hypothetical protein
MDDLDNDSRGFLLAANRCHGSTASANRPKYLLTKTHEMFHLTTLSVTEDYVVSVADE